MQVPEKEWFNSLCITATCFIFIIFTAHWSLRKRVNYIHPSACAILLGILVGGVTKITAIHVGSEAISRFHFNGPLFFRMFLPPIIFSAGYHLKNTKFFSHFLCITIFGVFGVFFMFFIVTNVCFALSEFNVVTLDESECFLFGAIFSSSDALSVTSLIPKIEVFSILVGESVLNDAVAIEVFSSFTNVVENYSFGGIIGRSMLSGIYGCLIGLGVAALGSFVFYQLKMSSIGLPRDSHQLLLLLCFAYLSMGIAQAASLSGIISLFFCSIGQSHYTYYSLTPSVQESSRIFSKTTSDASRYFLLLALGYSFFHYISLEYWNFTFIIVMFITIVTTRFFVVAVVCGICNLLPFLKYKFTLQDGLILSLGGIVRGSLCFALVSYGTSMLETKKEIQVIWTTTFSLVFGSSLLGGILTAFYIPEGKQDYFRMSASPEKQNIFESKTWIHKLWIRFDDGYLKKILGGRERNYELIPDAAVDMEFPLSESDENSDTIDENENCYLLEKQHITFPAHQIYCSQQNSIVETEMVEEDDMNSSDNLTFKV